MSGNISFRRYVDITSGVIGASTTRQRDLIGRIFTANPKCPTDRVIEFSNEDGVANQFGIDSEEYRRAIFYFNWVSPNITTPTSISFARYNDSPTKPKIYGTSAISSISDIQALGEEASITFVIDGQASDVIGIDMTTGIESYTDIAAKIQNEMARQFPSNVQLSSGTISFDSSEANFVFEGGAAGKATIGIKSGQLAEAIGWGKNANFVDGTDTVTPDVAIKNADNYSNNYATVLVLGDISLDQHIKNANVLNALGDVSYMYCIGVLKDNANNWSTQMRDISGVAMTLVDGAYDYADMVPMVQVAATNYNNQNATSSFMYREFSGLTPTVYNDVDADYMDGRRINFYGRTQTAGVSFGFYQRGVLMGGPNSPLDQNVYANEIWMKDYAGVAFMNLFRGLPELPANTEGEAYAMNTLQGVVEQAVYNGVISVGKVLTRLQQAAVSRLSGNAEAWMQVENIGYWFDVNITEEQGKSGITEYVLNYRLVYAKKDTIRRVEGRHALV